VSEVIKSAATRVAGHAEMGAYDVRALDLRTDYVDRPMGLENVRPHLSWRIESDRRNVRQTAYRILVSSNEEALEAGRGDLWDSGRVDSRRSVGIPYQGLALRSRQRCWWRVQVWDESGQVSEPSVASWWEMGLLSPDDWAARWIAADDAVAHEDRQTTLHWIWSTRELDCGEESRFFRCTFFLPEPTHGGVFLALGASFEKVTEIWLDGIALAMERHGCHPTGENLPVTALAAGNHTLAIKVQRKSPWPETYFQPPRAGLACLARFDAEGGRGFRVTSDAAWKTHINPGLQWYRPEHNDDSWAPVSTRVSESQLTIDPAMHLRRTFMVDRPLAKARLYATALGCYEARLNGRRIGNALLAPEISQYEKRTLYRVYDVTDLLQSGMNAVGFTVGDGWYASHAGRYAWGPPPRRLLAQLELTYVDGARQTIATDEHWRMSRSAIRQSEFDFGEIYDARLEQPGWDTAGFRDAAWQEARLGATPPCRLTAHVGAPVRAAKALEPEAISSPLPGVYVYDFGQNFAGWCRLRVKGPRGTRVDLRFGERLLPTGEVDQFVLLGSKAADAYILRGDAAGETFEPHFTYHGFRYVQVTGLPVAPSADVLHGVVVHSDLPITGQLRVDSPLLQRLWRNIVWTQRSNFVSIPTDCPTRAERMAYFGDVAIFWDAATFNMDVAAFTRRQMDNARDHQYATGAFAPLAPAPAEYIIYRAADGTALPGWSDGQVILPWVSWRRYADRGIVEQNWEAMNRHLQFILDRNPNYLWLHGRGPEVGDWLAVGDNHFMQPDTPPCTPLDLIATAYWAHCASLLAQMADVLRRRDDAQRLRSIRERIRNAFIKEYLKDDGCVAVGSQTSQVLALKFDLVPDDMRSRVVERLVADIHGRGIALSTGLIGTQFVLDVLADAGRVDLAYSLLLRSEYPSWGYMVARDATTVWERWDGSLNRNYATASHNHYALGSVGGFLFRSVAGIEELEPGFQAVRVRPLLDPRVKHGGADYDSILGRISTDWTQTRDGRFTLDVTIPANCSAHIHLPAHHTSRIEEGGRDIREREDLRILQRSDREVVVAVGSGRYQFTSMPNLSEMEFARPHSLPPGDEARLS
jgi:alpha-L-rhamnosidase